MNANELAQPNTAIAIVKDGKLCRISATELKMQDAQ